MKKAFFVLVLLTLTVSLFAQAPAQSRFIFPIPFKAVDQFGNEVDQTFWGEKEYFFLYHTATWCPPCVNGMPTLAQVAKDFGDRVGFLALLDDYSTNLSGSLRISENAGIPDTFLFVDARLPQIQGILALVRSTGIPSSVIIGKDGKRLMEPFHTAQARNRLNALFAQKQ